jgi:hypothetical protein
MSESRTLRSAEADVVAVCVGTDTRWSWRIVSRTGHLLQQSSATFPTLIEALMDGRGHLANTELGDAFGEADAAAPGEDAEQGRKSHASSNDRQYRDDPRLYRPDHPHRWVRREELRTDVKLVGPGGRGLPG